MLIGGRLSAVARFIYANPCVWAFWGSIENFQKGWFHQLLLLNVGLMFLQYLSLMIISCC